VPKPRALAVLAALAAFVLLIWVAVGEAPGWLYHGDLTGKDRAEELSRIRTALLACLAGGIALAGAFISHRSTNIAQRTLELNQQGQVTERFTRAVDQLGNEDQLAVRLGGIYALEQIMKESETLFAPIVELLSAFVRTRASSVIDEETDEPTGLAQDVLTAVEVLQRNNRPELRTIDLRGARLAGVSLASADLRSAQLDHADLRGARLYAGNLDRASCVGTRLSGANLMDATFVDAFLLRTDLDNASFHGMDLTDAALHEVSARNARFTAVTFTGTTLYGTDLTGAVLTRSNFTDVKFDTGTTWPDGFTPPDRD
jgi:uncharacterized protein YjbI with pentapeptide repeats